MVVKSPNLISYTTVADSFCLNDTMYGMSDHHLSHSSLESLSENSLGRSPSIDNKSGDNYSSSPLSDTYQRGGSQSSLSDTMSPNEYTDLRSPGRHEGFFGPNPLFEANLSANSPYGNQTFGIFGGPSNMQQMCNNGPLPMIGNSMEMKSPLEIKSMQSPPFYSHELPHMHSQLPSPNSHRHMPPINIPSMPTFSGYRPYPQVNEIFAQSKQDFYMQPPFYNGYPNYW